MDDTQPPAPLRENPDDEDFDERDREISDQQGEVGPGSQPADRDDDEKSTDDDD